MHMRSTPLYTTTRGLWPADTVPVANLTARADS